MKKKLEKYRIELYQEYPAYRTRTFIIETNKTQEELNKIKDYLEQSVYRELEDDMTDKEVNHLFGKNEGKIKWKEGGHGGYITFECEIHKIKQKTNEEEK